jgi:TRAP-type C4-dicarboxylate transport system permease small subunit
MWCVRGVSRTFARYVVYVSNAGATLGGIALLLLVAATLTEMVSRGVFGYAFMDVVSLGRVTMLITGFLAASYTLRHRRHVSLDLVVERLPRSLGWKVRILGSVIALVGLAVTTVGTLQIAWYSRDIGARLPADWDLPIWPFQMVVPVGLSMLTLQLLVDIVVELDSRLTGRYEDTRDTA